MIPKVLIGQRILKINILFQASLLKPSPKNKHSPKNQNVLKLSPESSRSSSRNSSVSPRERTTSTSMKNSSNRASPPGGNSSHSLNKKQSAASAASATASTASKAKSDNKVRPLVPWSKRNMGPPKNCNGWAWVGEGFEQKVYLNVSY